MSTSKILFNNKSLSTGKTIKINNTDIKLQTSKFIQGEGSIISLSVFLKENSLHNSESNLTKASPKITVRANYDQGSDTFSLTSYERLALNSKIGWYYLFIYLPFFGYIFYYVAITRKKKYLRKILTSLIKTRRTLKSEIRTKDELKHDWKKN